MKNIFFICLTSLLMVLCYPFYLFLVMLKSVLLVIMILIKSSQDYYLNWKAIVKFFLNRNKKKTEDK